MPDEALTSFVVSDAYHYAYAYILRVKHSYRSHNRMTYVSSI